MVITQPDGSIFDTGTVITLSKVITLTIPITDPLELEALAEDEPPLKPIGYQKVYSDGFTIISTTTNYTETHMVHIVAHDSAGNKTETEPFRVILVHEEKEEEEEEEPVEGPLDEGSLDEGFLDGDLLPAIDSERYAYLDRRLIAVREKLF